MTLMQAAVLGLLQGVTELFPVSSLGHSVLLPPLLGWSFNEHDPSFLVFLVATHFATALVLLLFFWQDWLHIIAGMLRSLRERRIEEDDTYAKIGWLLVVATIPAGLLGLLFQKSLQALFASPHFVAFFLLCNGALLYSAERLRRRRPHSDIHDDTRVALLTWRQALTIGLMQCLALFPGFSRTGASLSGGLLSELSRVDAARFAFLLATPIIFAAAVLKLPELTGEAIAPTLVGALCAAAGAYVSVRYLTHYFRTRTLTPFAIYCIGVGVLALVLLG